MRKSNRGRHGHRGPQAADGAATGDGEAVTMLPGKPRHSSARTRGRPAGAAWLVLRFKCSRLPRPRSRWPFAGQDRHGIGPGQIPQYAEDDQPETERVLWRYGLGEDQVVQRVA